MCDSTFLCLLHILQCLKVLAGDEPEAHRDSRGEDGLGSVGGADESCLETLVV